MSEFSFNTPVSETFDAKTHEPLKNSLHNSVSEELEKHENHNSDAVDQRQEMNNVGNVNSTTAETPMTRMMHKSRTINENDKEIREEQMQTSKTWHFSNSSSDEPLKQSSTVSALSEHKDENVDNDVHVDVENSTNSHKKIMEKHFPAYVHLFTYDQNDNLIDIVKAHTSDEKSCRKGIVREIHTKVSSLPQDDDVTRSLAKKIKNIKCNISFLGRLKKKFSSK